MCTYTYIYKNMYIPIYVYTYSKRIYRSVVYLCKLTIVISKTLNIVRSWHLVKGRDTNPVPRGSDQYQTKDLYLDPKKFLSGSGHSSEHVTALF